MAYVAARSRVVIAWSCIGWRVVIESQATIESDAENSQRVCHGKVDISDWYWRQRWQRSQLCGCAWGHPFKLYKHLNSCRTRAIFFTERVINAWNKLPTPVTDSRTPPSFKTSLDQIDILTLFSRVRCTFKTFFLVCAVYVLRCVVVV